MMASSSAIKTRVGTGPSLSAGRELVEQFVEPGLERHDGTGHFLPAAGHGVGVPACVAVLLLGERRLGDEGPEPGIVGLLAEVLELLVDDPELLSQDAQAPADLGQTAFDQRAVHEADCTETAPTSAGVMGYTSPV